MELPIDEGTWQDPQMMKVFEADAGNGGVLVKISYAAIVTRGSTCFMSE